MEALTAQGPPSISVTLAVNPPTLKEGEAVELSAMIVSHTSCPITILTYGSILDLNLAQRLKKSSPYFQCVDLDTSTHVQLQTRTCGRRSSIRHKLDHSDSRYFHTLQPEVPYKLSSPCFVSNQELNPGHKYCLLVDEEQKVSWWREGTKDEVLESPGQELPAHMLEPSGDPITLTGIVPIDFMVPSGWKNIGASVVADCSAMAQSSHKGASDPPSVTATLSLDMSDLSGELAAELSISAVSHALAPVTVWIWSSVLHAKVAQGPGAFTLTHLDTNTSVPTQEMFRTEQDGGIHPNDRYFPTLHPEQPSKFRVPITSFRSKQLAMKPGRYRLAVTNRVELQWWKEGTREEVVAPPGKKPEDDMYVPSGEPIIFSELEPIEFTIPVG